MTACMQLAAALEATDRKRKTHRMRKLGKVVIGALEPLIFLMPFSAWRLPQLVLGSCGQQQVMKNMKEAIQFVMQMLCSFSE